VAKEPGQLTGLFFAFFVPECVPTSTIDVAQWRELHFLI
jgi:hypothetical protein